MGKPDAHRRLERLKGWEDSAFQQEVAASGSDSGTQGYGRADLLASSSPRERVSFGTIGLAGSLPAKKRLLELPGLGRREPRQSEHLHCLIRKLRLFGRKRRRLVPAQTSANVLMDPRRGACELVGEFMQLTHLLEQRLELHVVNRHNWTKGISLNEPSRTRPSCSRSSTAWS